MDKDSIVKLIADLEHRHQEQKASEWDSFENKAYCLEQYDKAICSLKEIAYIEYDLIIE